MDSNSPFPKRLRQARTETGISQKELGLRIGMEPTSASGRMNHYEKGRHQPDYETVEQLANELGKPIAFFYCEKDSLAELICILDKLSEERRKELINQLNSD